MNKPVANVVDLEAWKSAPLKPLVLLPIYISKSLDELRHICSYPFDLKKDMALLKRLEEKFPTVDVLEAVETWAIYKIDFPLGARMSPRSQLHTWFVKSIEYGRNLKETSALPDLSVEEARIG